MNIRNIVRSDFNQIHELICQLHGLHVRNRPDIFNDTDPCSREYLEGLLNDAKMIALVVEDHEKIIGFCDVTIKESTS